MESTAKLYSLHFGNAKTYLFATLFVIGNLALPQLCHTLHLGGPTFLPIYFFTLIGAYKYGRNVGLMTAILSPVANALLFGMPAIALLPVILVKSTLLALVAGEIARRSNKITIGTLLLTVVLYQVAGTAIEWGIIGDFYAAAQDFRIGVPGMLLQVFGGYAVLKMIARK